MRNCAICSVLRDMDDRLILALAVLLLLAAPSSAWSQRSGFEPTVRLPRLSSGFGPRSDPLHRGRAIHRGIDLPGAAGTPILASASGIIRFAGTAGTYGNMIEIEHAEGLRTRYAHLSRILVRRGAMVALGETIALMGSTGRSTGNHLHFEVRSDGRAVNPFLLMAAASSAAKLQAGTATRRSAFARDRAASMPRDGANALPTGAAAATGY